jgi:glycosyltransferase involved in cell wall biosynthesis
VSGGPGVHQFVPMLHRYDAVGEHARTVRGLLVEAGVPSRIYTEIPDPATAAETVPYARYESDAVAGDVLVYQFATRSEIAGWLAGRPEPVVVNYHSVTPPEYFGPWNDRITRLQVGALSELALLAPRAALGVAVSHFDAGELLAAGCSKVEVIPVANVRVPPLEPSPALVEEVRSAHPGPGARWLSVGRLAPNKAHQRTIAALFVTRATSDPAARLTLVGSPTVPSYAAALSRYAAQLGLADAVDFVSGVDEERLAAYYRAAHVLVMLSEHEGYGVPLVEAMGQGVPIVVADAGAVREVVGDAAVLLEASGPRHVAASVSRLLGDPAERARLSAAGRARFDELGLGHAGERLVEALRGLRSPVPAPG